MPIDTQNKRRSATQMLAIQAMPVPSGTIGIAARENATWLYSGITPFLPLPGTPSPGDLYWARS